MKISWRQRLYALRFGLLSMFQFWRVPDYEKFISDLEAMEPSRITHAAILGDDGRIWGMPEPLRHNHVIALMIKNEASPAEGTQGFLTDRNKFVNRREAYRIAKRAGQLKAECDSGLLFTEDVW